MIAHSVGFFLELGSSSQVSLAISGNDLPTYLPVRPGRFRPDLPTYLPTRPGRFRLELPTYLSPNQHFSSRAARAIQVLLKNELSCTLNFLDAGHQTFGQADGTDAGFSWAKALKYRARSARRGKKWPSRGVEPWIVANFGSGETRVDDV